MPAGRLQVASIVEGHGEVASLPILLRRIGMELLGAQLIDALKPSRKPRNRLILDKDGELSGAVDAAARLLSNNSTDESPRLILVLIDADDDCAATISRKIIQTAHSARSDFTTTCVVAVKEYETWFVAAADSLRSCLNLSKGEPPDDPERQRCGKAWIEERYRNRQYLPRIDQAKLTARMDLHLCRQRSPSFDKLCRELEKALRKK